MSRDFKIRANGNSRGNPALLLAAASRIEWNSPSLFSGAGQSAAARAAVPSRNESVKGVPYPFQSPSLQSDWNTPSPWNAYVPSCTVPSPPPHKTLPVPVLFSPVTLSAEHTLDELLTLKKNASQCNDSMSTSPWVYKGKQSKNDLMYTPKNFLPSQRASKNESSKSKACTRAIKIVHSFTAYDVVCGRGRKPRKANQEFNLLLNLHSSEYASACKTDKPPIVYKVIEAIKSKHGRFLKKYNHNQVYRVMTEMDEIYGKVSEALRHASKPKLPPYDFQSDPNQSSMSVYPTVPHQDVEAIQESFTKVPIVLEKSVARRSNSTTTQRVSFLSTWEKKTRATRFKNHNYKTKRQKRESHERHKSYVPNVSVAKTTETKIRAEAGVRIAVTRRGKLEVRYKCIQQEKQVLYPRYIATVSDRETAVCLGNLVARSIQDSGKTFEAAKHDAILVLSNLGGRADGKGQFQTQVGKENRENLANNDLVNDVVDTLLKQDEEADATITTLI